MLTSTYLGAEKKCKKDGIQYERIGIRLPGLGLSPHLSFLTLLGPKIKKTPHDLVVEEFTPPIGFCLLPLWTKKPVVSIIQWFFFEQWEKRYKLPFAKCMHYLASKNIYKYFIVQTESMYKNIKELIPNAIIKKIPCGINIDSFYSSKDIGNFVLFLGRLEINQKGLDLLMDIWRFICSKEKVPLIIAGSGQNEMQLKEISKKYGINRFVKFVGKVKGTQKKALLQSCRFLVMPSRAETFGMVALEAMAAQKTVIAFDIENLNEVLRPEWSILVSPFDKAKFAESILQLWKNKDLCVRLGQKGQIEAKNYLWDKLAIEQEKFYSEVLKGNYR